MTGRGGGGLEGRAGRQKSLLCGLECALCLVDPQPRAGGLLPPGSRRVPALTLGLEILDALERDRVLDLGARQRRVRVFRLAADLKAAVLGRGCCRLALTGSRLRSGRVLGLDHLKRGLQPRQPAGRRGDRANGLHARDRVRLGHGGRLILGRQGHQPGDLASDPVGVAIARQ